VDSKTRDLDVATLIAFHLRKLGVECHLEPLEADRAVAAAYRPAMIVFNHLTASHLVAYSKRLAEMGVLTAVLPNEGIQYDDDASRFYAGRHHNGAHIDYFFCWNERHRETIRQQGFYKETHVEVIGVPRFDFYFKPWSESVYTPTQDSSARPKILVCTNFGTAYFYELPREHADKLFAPWAGRIPIYSNYWRSIEAQWQSRTRFFGHLKALIDSDKYEILLRPHPMEDAAYYRRWLDKLPPTQLAHIRIDSTSNITPLILDCDLQISCETCTTALESWIADKPTVELVFDRDPLWYFEEQAKANVPCEDPSKLVSLVDNQLSHSLFPELREARRKHLEKWCSSPDGSSCLRVAEIIAEALRNKQGANWSKLTANDYRRAMKLKSLRGLGVAYHFDLLLPLKRVLFSQRYAVKDFSYRKSIKPRDVSEARSRLENVKTSPPREIARS